MTQGKTTRRRPESYRLREYRSLISPGELVDMRVAVGETDLHILADRDMSDQARELVLQCRMQIEQQIARDPQFLKSLVPLPQVTVAPKIIREMLAAGRAAGVGPMAAVAGAVAQFVGEGLLRLGCREVIVENGGDIFLARSVDCTIGIFAGSSPLSYTVGIRLATNAMPCGVCTSSGTVGHSLSFGEADSVTVVAESAALADSVATRLGNEVGRQRGGKVGVQNALAIARQFSGIRGVVVISGEVMGAVGDIELVRV